MNKSTLLSLLYEMHYPTTYLDSDISWRYLIQVCTRGLGNLGLGIYIAKDAGQASLPVPGNVRGASCNSSRQLGRSVQCHNSGNSELSVFLKNREFELT